MFDDAPEPLTLKHPDGTAAADHLAIPCGKPAPDAVG